MNKEVSLENAQLYDFIAHEYGYTIEYIKDLDMQSIINLIRAAIVRQKKDSKNLYDTIRFAVHIGQDLQNTNEISEEEEEINLRRLIKDMTKASDEEIDEMKEKNINVPL